MDERATDTPATETVQSADGTEIAFERHGEGDPLVLLHGGGDRNYWKPLLPHFVDDYEVVTPDRRGRGDSGDEPEEYSLEREVEDVLAVIDAIDGEPVLFGHSFGGLQAIEAAREAPVEKLIAYEPAVLVGDYRETADLADQMEARLDEGDRRGAMKLHLREVLFGPDADDEAFEQWLDEWPHWPEAAQAAELNLRMDRVIERYRLPDELDVDAPALVLTGSEGPSHLRDSVRAVDEALPDSRLVEFEGVGHMGPTEATDRVVEEIRQFLAE